MSSTATRHPLPSGGTVTGGPAGLGPVGLLPLAGPRQGGLQRDWNILFLWWDHDIRALRDWDLLFLWWYSDRRAL